MITVGRCVYAVSLVAAVSFACLVGSGAPDARTSIYSEVLQWECAYVSPALEGALVAGLPGRASSVIDILDGHAVTPDDSLWRIIRASGVPRQILASFMDGLAVGGGEIPELHLQRVALMSAGTAADATRSDSRFVGEWRISEPTFDEARRRALVAVDFGDTGWVFYLGRFAHGWRIITATQLWIA